MNRALFLRFVPLYIALLTGISSLQCQTEITYKMNEELQRPVGLQVYALNGGVFRVQYYVQNEEDTFDGYNLYISRISSGDQNTLEPYQLTGSTPTLLHSAADVDYLNPVTVDIYRYMDVIRDINGKSITSFTPFETGTRYYFKIRAHSRFNDISLPSNEVSAITKP